MPRQRGAGCSGPGTRFSIGSGFSGECVRTGQLLRCDDSETDPFVDRESCRLLGIRSIIAVPIRWDEAVIGILEVFAPEPYAFSTNDPLALKRLAGIISTAVHRAGEPEPDAAETQSGLFGEIPRGMDPRSTARLNMPLPTTDLHCFPL